MSRNKSDPVVEFLDLVAELAARMYWHRWQQESVGKKTARRKRACRTPCRGKRQSKKRLPRQAVDENA